VVIATLSAVFLWSYQVESELPFCYSSELKLDSSEVSNQRAELEIVLIGEDWVRFFAAVIRNFEIIPSATKTPAMKMPMIMVMTETSIRVKALNLKCFLEFIK
jgi:hypothetical protein